MRVITHNIIFAAAICREISWALKCDKAGSGAISLSVCQAVAMLAIAVVSAMVIPVAAQTQSPAGIDALITQVVQLSNQGKYAEAAPIAQQALTLAEQTLGRDHPRTLSSVNNLAYLYQAQGRYKEAEPLYQRALERASES